MKEKKEINVAVVGLGVGLHHAKFYLNEKRVNLKYLIDFDKKKREIARKLFPRVNIPTGCTVGAKSFIYTKNNLEEWSVFIGNPIKFHSISHIPAST